MLWLLNTGLNVDTIVRISLCESHYLCVCATERHYIRTQLSSDVSGGDEDTWILGQVQDMHV